MTVNKLIASRESLLNAEELHAIQGGKSDLTHNDTTLDIIKRRRFPKLPIPPVEPCDNA